MKKSELREIIREEIQKLNENADIVKVKDIPKILKRKDLVYNLFGGPDNITLKPLVDWMVDRDNESVYKKIQSLLGKERIKGNGYEIYISYDDSDIDNFDWDDYNWAHVQVDFKTDTTSIKEFEKIDKNMKRLHKIMMDIIKRHAKYRR